MPYIGKLSRSVFDPDINELLSLAPKKGDIVYIITRLLHGYIKQNGLSFNTLCDCDGICGCASKEFYRQITAKREDQKKKENGPVSELDK